MLPSPLFEMVQGFVEVLVLLGVFALGITALARGARNGAGVGESFE